jgi:hypothetical protein
MIINIILTFQTTNQEYNDNSPLATKKYFQKEDINSKKKIGA